MAQFIEIAADLEHAGLLWQPEIGDEVADRHVQMVSVLVDNKAMSPSELRSQFLWLPNIEQMVFQLEARQAILFHTGFQLSETSLGYKTVVQSPFGPIESLGENLRTSMGIALRKLLVVSSTAKGIPN